MTGEDGVDIGVKNSPEAAATKGMEVNKKVEGRLETWTKNMLEKNQVSQAHMEAWNKLKGAIKEGSLRREVMENLTPVIESAAAVRGYESDKTKWVLKVIGGVGEVVGLVGFAVPEARIAGAVGMGANMLSNKMESVEKTIVTSMGNIQEKLNQSDFAHKVDSIVEKIFGWKGQEKPAEQVFVAKAEAPPAAPVELPKVAPAKI